MSESHSLSFAEFVNEKLWLLTEQPDGWRERVSKLESQYNSEEE